MPLSPPLCPPLSSLASPARRRVRKHVLPCVLGASPCPQACPPLLPTPPASAQACPHRIHRPSTCLQVRLPARPMTGTMSSGMSSLASKCPQICPPLRPKAGRMSSSMSPLLLYCIPHHISCRQRVPSHLSYDVSAIACQGCEHVLRHVFPGIPNASRRADAKIVLRHAFSSP